jgi:hypothetical protein
MCVVSEIVKARMAAHFILETFLHRSLVAGARAVVGIAPDCFSLLLP